MEPKLIAPLAAENECHLPDNFIATYASKPPPFGPLGAVVHARTYAAEVEDPSAPGGVRLETWTETCRRCIEGMFGYLRQAVRATGQRYDVDEGQRHMREAFDLMWRGIWTPPGRGLEHMGRATVKRKGAGVLQNCGFVSTAHMHRDPAHPFCVLMDYSMLGIGMGFDTLGARFRVHDPMASASLVHVVEDSREGWVAALRALVAPYFGRGVLPGTWDFTAIRPAGARLSLMGKYAAGPEVLRDLLRDVDAVLRARVGQRLGAEAIVDVMTLIGRCVAAGQRRSAEIALGQLDDEDFATLKAPGALGGLYAQRTALEAADVAIGYLDEAIAGRRAAAAGLSPLSPKYLMLQQQIAEAEAERREACEALPGWMAITGQIDAHPLNHHRWAANNSYLVHSADELDAADLRRVADGIRANGEPGLFFVGAARTRGRFGDPPNDDDALVAGVNPCGEQPLEHLEVCTLVETYPSRATDRDEWLRALKWAHLYGVVVTTIPTHAPETNAVIAKNRRIGTSVTGVWELYERLGASDLGDWLDRGYREVRHWNDVYSAWMGIRRSVRVTTVKPSGTVSLLFGVEGGLKVPTARHYMRTVRMQTNSPIAGALARAGYRVEPALREQGVVVAYFPCEAAPGRVADEVSLWEQAELAALLQDAWSDNAVSATLTFQPHEAADIERVIALVGPRLKGLAMLPLLTHGYPQAPYIPCTAEEVEQARAALRPIDLSLAERETAEAFCDGGACEVRAA